MDTNNEEYQSIKNAIVDKVENTVTECVERYKRMSVLETVFTNFSASSDPADHRKALILAKHLLKQRDKVVGDVFKLNCELLSEMGNNWDKVNELLSDLKLRYDNSGKVTKEKFRYLTDTAVYLTNDYAIAHPHHLNNQKCARGVTAALKQKLRTHFTNKKEQKKACLIGIPTDKTIEKHLGIAFAELGFPEYGKPKKMLGLADINILR